MAVMTLEDVVKQLQTNNRTSGDVVKNLKDFINLSKRNALDNLEAEREKKKQATEEVKAGAKTIKSPDIKGGGGFTAIFAGLGLKGALLKITGILTAGTAALVLAFEGLRGWELKAVDKLKGLLKMPTVISNAMIKLRNASLAMFGLTAAGLPIKQADGKMGKSMSIQAQVAQKLANMKKAFLLQFGIGADGKNVNKVGPKGMQKQPVHIRAGRAIIRLLSPITGFVSGIGKWFAGAGAKISKFASTFLSGGKGVLKLMGKILWPIGIIISLFDGITAFRDEKGTFYDKLGAGIGGFIGSFVGAPFDLLKSAVNWILKKIFPGLTSEDGSWDESTIMGSWLSKFESFSIAKFISNLIQGIFALPKAAIEWIGTLFTDPKEALSQLWQGLLKVFSVGGKAVKGILDILWFPINMAIDWVTKKFGWREEDAPPFKMTDFVIKVFKTIKDFIMTIPQRLGFAIREWFADVTFKMSLAFAGIGEIINDLLEFMTLKLKTYSPRFYFGRNRKELAEIEGQMDGLFGKDNMSEDTLNKVRAARDQLANTQAQIERERAAAFNVDNSTNSNTTILAPPGDVEVLSR